MNRFIDAASGGVCSFGRDGNESDDRLSIDYERSVIVIGQEEADDMAADCGRAMAEARFDQITAEITVHAVVRPARDVAGIAFRIDFHVDMTALLVIAALPCRTQLEVAFDHYANRFLGVVAERNH
jgi:hypothetical protein